MQAGPTVFKSGPAPYFLWFSVLSKRLSRHPQQLHALLSQGDQSAGKLQHCYRFRVMDPQDSHRIPGASLGS